MELFLFRMVLPAGEGVPGAGEQSMAPPRALTLLSVPGLLEQFGGVGQLCLYKMNDEVYHHRRCRAVGPVISLPTIHHFKIPLFHATAIY